ncbi:MAG: class I SAM-dependent methyltransferase [Pyrinomonadaceae bacterium]|nr:class I SAM-dependent methyltransferase [Sphingobacteriaceae bacterium]
MIGRAHEYEAMATCETALWWYKCLHDYTINALKKNKVATNDAILDAGCGTGGLLKKIIAEEYSNLQGFDLSPDALEFASNATGLPLKLYDILEVSQHYEPNSFDVIISHDIICLLPEGKDALAISQLFRVLKPGGLLIMNLPALSAFKGTHDLAVGITKRYTKQSIRSLVGEYGKIESMVYWPFLLSFPVYLTRLAQRAKLRNNSQKNFKSDVKMPDRMLNELFYQLSNFENRVMKAKPWGSSLFTLVRKEI